MPGTERSKWPNMVNIHFACMACHRFGDFERISTATPEEVVPKPDVGRKFRIVPCKATHIVFPDVAVGIVSMHKVPVVPETVPMSGFNLIFVILKIEVQLLFNSRFFGIAGIGQTE